MMGTRKQQMEEEKLPNASQMNSYGVVERMETYGGVRRILKDSCARTKLVEARSAESQINLRM